MSADAPSAPSSPSAAERLRRTSKLVIDRWVERVREELPTPAGASGPALVDNLPGILEALAVELETDGAAQQRRDSKRELFAEHVESRSDWSSYSIEHLVHEYGILRRTVMAALEEQSSLSSEERNRLLDFIEEGVRVTTSRFAEIQGFHERLELQYLKLIEQLVSETAHASTLEGSLERLLDVVLHGMRAEVAAVLLYRADTLEMRLGSAAGASPELASSYRAALALSAISQPRALATSAAVEAVDASSLEPEPRQSLEALGIEWLLLLHLPARGLTPGTLSLGFRQKRALDPIELRLLEVLADRLALILASVELQDQSGAALRHVREQNALIEAEKNALEEDRRQRDELIATMSHDLRNPLGVAKMGAELIKKGAVNPAATQSLTDKILTSIDRSDRMIHDLLDSYRVRAGKRLPLTMTRYSMVALANDVIKDMTSLHGDRFRLDVPKGDVQGYWSFDGMRRVLENLLSNGAKYGAPGTPVTVTVEENAGKMRMSVNSRGAPLSKEEQTRILQPYERGNQARHAGKAGWGIGLTLVRGLVDAHGGELRVESSEEHGTTFIIENPMDSRGAQDLAS